MITSWDYQADATPPSQLRLKVARSAGGDSFLVVGQSDLKQPSASGSNPFTTRIPVQAGDVIGLYQSQLSECGISSATGFSTHQVTATDVQPSGTPVTFTPGADFKLDIGAAIEPDADQDGFGDETQDQCPTEASTQGSCPAPVTAPVTAPLTGQRAAALKKCKKKFRDNPAKRRKCRKKANRLPA